MTKSELKTGMIVTRRDGKKLTVYRNCICSFGSNFEGDVIVDAKDEQWHSLKNYTEDMRLNGHPEYDIIRVEIVHHPYDYNKYSENASIENMIWERPNPAKKMTVSEIEKILGYKIEVVSEK